MKVIFDVNHPGHVHYFKNVAFRLIEKKQEILFTASDKDVTIELLKDLGLPYQSIGSYRKGLVGKALDTPLMDLKMLRIVRSFEPDMIFGAGSIRGAHASAIYGVPCIALEDTEHSSEQLLLYKPFTDLIITPEWFGKSLGEKQVRFKGFLESAYTNPNCFVPDESILRGLGISTNERYIVLRFVSWDATHDIGQRGISDPKDLIDELEGFGRILISSEGSLPSVLEKYRIRTGPSNFHNLLYFASLYLGEGGTAATEAALLGTPSILLSSLAKECSNFHKLRDDYGLLYFYDSQKEAIDKAKGILGDPNSKAIWQSQRKKAFISIENVNEMLMKIIESYGKNKTLR